jgi:hypothetical protein
MRVEPQGRPMDLLQPNVSRDFATFQRRVSDSGPIIVFQELLLDDATVVRSQALVDLRDGPSASQISTDATVAQVTRWIQYPPTANAENVPVEAVCDILNVRTAACFRHLQIARASADV